MPVHEEAALATSNPKPGARGPMLGAVVLVWFTTYFLRLAWVNVSASASHALGSSAAELGSFITFFFVGYVVANVAGGFLVDRFGARRVVLTALWILVAATFCFGRVTTTAQGWGVQFVMGLSCGSFYAAVITLVASWFPPGERGTASGLLFAAGPFAVMVANLVYPLILRVSDWTRLYAFLGLYAALVAGAATLYLRNGDTKSPSIAGGVPRSPHRRARVLNANLLLLCGTCFGTGWGTWGFTFCSNILLVRGNLGLSADAAATVALWFGTGGVVAIPLCGLLCDRFPAQRPYFYIFELASMIVALFAFSQQVTLAGFCATAFVLGMAAYAFLPILGGLLPELVDAGTLGATAGIANASGQLAAAAAPLAIGAIVDRSGSIPTSLATLAFGPALGVACLVSLVLLMRRTGARTPLAGTSAG